VGRTVVVARGPSVYLLSGSSPPQEFPWPRRRNGSNGRSALPSGLLAALGAGGVEGPVVVGGRELFASLVALWPDRVRRADASNWHEALGALPPPNAAVEREYVLARARADLEAALRSPVEVLVTLAREEERVERAVGRELRAAEAFVAVPGTVLDEYASTWARERELLAAHHRELLARLESEAVRTVPNLSALLGARTAARLVAVAGGVAPLARISSSRLQLLGARRRPNPERGPRFGVLYRTEGADRVPADRRAAFVRSVAALAAIAARADALTGSDLTDRLVRRRELRRGRLARRRP
jgi:hypothetical protein